MLQEPKNELPINYNSGELLAGVLPILHLRGLCVDVDVDVDVDVCVRGLINRSLLFLLLLYTTATDIGAWPG
jgi:hypothetical protein